MKNNPAHDEIPLIYTSARGNYPIEELELEAKWEITPDVITLIEEYKFKDTGEMARRSVHVLTKRSLESTTQAQSLKN